MTEMPFADELQALLEVPRVGQVARVDPRLGSPATRHDRGPGELDGRHRFVDDHRRRRVRLPPRCAKHGEDDHPALPVDSAISRCRHTSSTRYPREKLVALGELSDYLVGRMPTTSGHGAVLLARATTRGSAHSCWLWDSMLRDCLRQPSSMSFATVLAASSCIDGRMCEYVSSVIITDA